MYKGHENDRVKLALGGGGVILHPAVEQAVKALMPNWEQVQIMQIPSNLQELFLK